MGLNIPRNSGGERVWVVNDESIPANVNIADASISGGVPLTIADSPSIDPFGRLRVSQPHTVFDSKQLYDKASIIFDESITDNSGTATSTHSTTDARVRMEVGATDIIIRQTYERYNYQPGKGQLAFLTFNFIGASTDVDKKVGMFDANDGIFVQLSGSNLSVVLRKGAWDREVLQANWNLDTMDGNGASGITLDLTKVQIFIIDFEWLGVGRVRTGFVIDGVIYYVHEFNHANNIATVYMSTPNLPVRYEIDATDGGTGAMDHICATVISEGGFDPHGKLFSANTGALVTLASANTIYGMIAIRLRTTHLDMLSYVEDFTSLSDSNANYYLHMYLNPTLAGGSWSWSDVNTTYSGMQFADGGNGVTINGGIRMFSAILAGNESVHVSIENERNLGSKIDGTRDIFALAIQPLTNNQDCAVAINWSEI